ncbi:MAG: TolC family protein [Candidatus Gastranaerophilales bacterium]|nr:TolC family protein [Candidatus Gastranaerophilales bacterium]
MIIPKNFAFLFTLFISPAFAYNISWFDNFNDPVLSGYIEEALNLNKDILIARKNILKYRQEKNLNISAEFPEIDVGADYLLLKIPKTAIPRNDIQTNSFALPFITVWEADYLGKNYNKIQKSRLDIENAVYELESTGIIVASDVAEAYFNISNLNKQIEFQEEIKNLRQKNHARKEKMLKNGTISKTEFNESENVLLSEINLINNLYKERRIFLTQLAFLLGKTPDITDKIIVTPFENINFTGEYPDTLHGDIIFCRPDIMQKENEMKKARIDITIAKKEFFPQITIAGVMVFSTIVQNFGWDGVFAALSAGAFQNLFDGGKRIFTLKKRKIEFENAVEEYLKTQLTALKEINDALFTLKKDFGLYKNNEKMSALENDNFVRAIKSYESGVKNFIEYSDENINSLKQDMELIKSKNQNFINLLSLYKASGGAL